MLSRLLAGTGVAVALAAWACGGTSSPSTPTPMPGGGGGGSASEVIRIVGSAGAQAFTPNPADAAAAGTTVAWVNNDSVTHHIVMNDGSLDTGNIAPGQTSPAMTMMTNGGNYHCTIHPSMVGSLKASTGVPPPCTGQYC